MYYKWDTSDEEDGMQIDLKSRPGTARGQNIRVDGSRVKSLVADYDPSEPTDDYDDSELIKESEVDKLGSNKAAGSRLSPGQTYDPANPTLSDEENTNSSCNTDKNLNKDSGQNDSNENENDGRWDSQISISEEDLVHGQVKSNLVVKQAKSAHKHSNNPKKTEGSYGPSGFDSVDQDSSGNMKNNPHKYKSSPSLVPTDTDDNTQNSLADDIDVPEVTFDESDFVLEKEPFEKACEQPDSAAVSPWSYSGEAAKTEQSIVQQDGAISAKHTMGEAESPNTAARQEYLDGDTRERLRRQEDVDTRNEEALVDLFREESDAADRIEEDVGHNMKKTKKKMIGKKLKKKGKKLKKDQNKKGHTKTPTGDLTMGDQRFVEIRKDRLSADGIEEGEVEDVVTVAHKKIADVSLSLDMYEKVFDIGHQHEDEQREPGEIVEEGKRRTKKKDKRDKKKKKNRREVATIEDGSQLGDEDSQKFPSFLAGFFVQDEAEEEMEGNLGNLSRSYDNNDDRTFQKGGKIYRKRHNSAADDSVKSFDQNVNEIQESRGQESDHRRARKHDERAHESRDKRQHEVRETREGRRDRESRHEVLKDRDKDRDRDRDRDREKSRTDRGRNDRDRMRDRERDREREREKEKAREKEREVIWDRDRERSRRIEVDERRSHHIRSRSRERERRKRSVSADKERRSRSRDHTSRRRRHRSKSHERSPDRERERELERERLKRRLRERSRDRDSERRSRRVSYSHSRSPRHRSERAGSDKENREESHRRRRHAHNEDSESDERDSSRRRHRRERREREKSSSSSSSSESSASRSRRHNSGHRYHNYSQQSSDEDDASSDVILVEPERIVIDLDDEEDPPSRVDITHANAEDDSTKLVDGVSIPPPPELNRNSRGSALIQINPEVGDEDGGTQSDEPEGDATPTRDEPSYSTQPIWNEKTVQESDYDPAHPTEEGEDPDTRSSTPDISISPVSPPEDVHPDSPDRPSLTEAGATPPTGPSVPEKVSAVSLTPQLPIPGAPRMQISVSPLQQQQTFLQPPVQQSSPFRPVPGTQVAGMAQTLRFPPWPLANGPSPSMLAQNTGHPVFPLSQRGLLPIPDTRPLFSGDNTRLPIRFGSNVPLVTTQAPVTAQEPFPPQTNTVQQPQLPLSTLAPLAQLTSLLPALEKVKMAVSRDERDQSQQLKQFYSAPTIQPSPQAKLPLASSTASNVNVPPSNLARPSRGTGDLVESNSVVDMEMSPADDDCELELPSPISSQSDKEDKRKKVRKTEAKVTKAAVSVEVNKPGTGVTDKGLIQPVMYLKALSKAIEKLTPKAAVAAPPAAAAPEKKSHHSRKKKTEAAMEEDVAGSAVDLTNKEKFLKKLHLQERVIDEVKLAIKPFYSSKKITKEQYKLILRKAVPKVCHSKSGNINPQKIQQLVEAYVSKIQKGKSLGGSKKKKAAKEAHASKESVQASVRQNGEFNKKPTR